ncbi:MAG: hypothetical protein PHT44_01765 [Candidatus Portnoybacteria bacterium]|nr:hypothetical protein [Candidatus Portnoybacteria bacterium]MDD4982678.1 hypothetical protein [Candidatus Portnoybacteria bacterium]
MSKDRFCLKCGYRYPSQRVGRCPNCDGEGAGHISPEAIRQFREFDKKGGDILSLRLHNKKIRLIMESCREKSATLSVLDIVITFADYGKGPQVIYTSPNSDGFGIDDIPKKLLAEATQMAGEIINTH